MISEKIIATETKTIIKSSKNNKCQKKLILLKHFFVWLVINEITKENKIKNTRKNSNGSIRYIAYLWKQTEYRIRIIEKVLIKSAHCTT